MQLKIENDGKGKWQSWSGDIGLDHTQNFPEGHAFLAYGSLSTWGENEAQVRRQMKEGLKGLAARLTKLAEEI